MKGGHLQMITISLQTVYYALGIASILCTSAYKIGYSAFNDWCINEFSEIVGRRTTPHNFRRSRATNLVCYDHRALETAQKLLGHESSETTQMYVIREDTEDADEAFV